jgi:hypothetical protein
MAMYKIAVGLNKKMLEGAVNCLIEEGWRLQGGVCVSSSAMFYQALILPETVNLSTDTAFLPKEREMTRIVDAFLPSASTRI